jgi:hypothetical protein
LPSNPNTNNDLNERYTCLLASVDTYSKKLERPTSALLHDYLYLCLIEEKILRKYMPYEFKALLRGPFSEELKADIDVLHKSEQIKFEKSDNKLMLSPKGKSFMEKSFKNGLSKVAPKILESLQRIEYNSPHAISDAIQPHLNNKNLGDALPIK